MSMIRNAMTMSFFPLDFGLLAPNAGAFAIAPDGGLRLHLASPLADIPPMVYTIKVDSRVHATSDAAWLCRLFNVAMKFGAVRMFAAYDAYRNKNLQNEVCYSFPAAHAYGSRWGRGAWLRACGCGRSKPHRPSSTSTSSASSRFPSACP